MARRVTHLRHSLLYLPTKVSKRIYSASNLEMFYKQFTQNQLSKYNRAPKTRSCIYKMHFLHTSSIMHLKCISHSPHHPCILWKEHNPKGWPFYKSPASDPFPCIKAGQHHTMQECTFRQAALLSYHIL